MLAFICWIALIAPAYAQTSVTTACTAQILKVQSTQGDADGRRPVDAKWQTVTLPDNWTSRWPDYSGTAWYRVDWQRQCINGQNQRSSPVALALESIVMAGEVYVNDSQIWRDKHLTEPLSRSWNMPRYWRLPETLLKDGVNTLWVRVIGVAGQTPGLGPVYLGELHATLQLYEDLQWQNRTLFVVNIVVNVVMGILFFCIWLMRRTQSEHGWYALMTLFWVLFASNVLATTPWPFPDSVMAAKANAVMAILYVASFCMFTWRFGGQSLPRIEKVMWTGAALLVVMLMVAPAAYLAGALGIGILIPAALFFINCLQFPFHAWRTRKTEHVILAGLLLFFFAVVLHDLLLLLKIIENGRAYSAISSIATTLAMSGILGLRHARNMRQIDRFNHQLEVGIGRARADLSATLEREHALALTNNRLQERLQIAHDLHDGLGGSLVRMMAMVQQADMPLQNQQVLSMLKLIRDDLRQTIDSGSSAGVKVPATPTEWIAPLRHRFMQLFDELEIDATWQLPAEWRTSPNALQCLTLTRLLEESLVNVVKHSRARRVEVRMHLPEYDVLVLSVEDNGVGFDVAAVRQAGISVGMRSMHARIIAIHGTLEVSSKTGRTALTATIQLTPSLAPQ
ncbi:ATP-binding protein [Herminiimonas sp. KBW02]|uniref:sensor histidine kinase n=1 Tax=Herminiimonas sp. KBW02 TaxID=2153363 RepID=UPI001F32F2FA|nr:ATP-binding protein [Herminiimonas sp. KBW02]